MLWLPLVEINFLQWRFGFMILSIMRKINDTIQSTSLFSLGFIVNKYNKPITVDKNVASLLLVSILNQDSLYKGI
jgi:hypothetical protein